MSKLQTKKDVVERYWPEYLDYCMCKKDDDDNRFAFDPTINGFWLWYITDGPMGVKHKNLFYKEARVEYV